MINDQTHRFGVRTGIIIVSTGGVPLRSFFGETGTGALFVVSSLVVILPRVKGEECKNVYIYVYSSE